MSETIITALISAIASLIVAFGTWHVSMRKERDKSTEELKEILEEHRTEYLSKIRDVQDDISKVNATVQQQIAVIEVKMDTLSERVDKHNGIYDKTIALQQDVALHEEKIKVANHRIDDLEHKAV